MSEPYQDPEIEEKMECEKEPDFAVGTFFFGLVIGAMICVFIFLCYVSVEYSTIKDTEGFRVLIECNDGSSKWFKMPSCKSSTKGKK